MTTKDEALKLALDYVEGVALAEIFRVEVRTAIKEALAQPEQESYGYLKLNTGRFVHEVEGCPDPVKAGYLPLYTTPPQRKPWVGLTDEEIDTWPIVGHESLRNFVRAIEAKLKEKNA